MSLAVIASNPYRGLGLHKSLPVAPASRPRLKWFVALSLSVLFSNGGPLMAQILPQAAMQRTPPMSDEPPMSSEFSKAMQNQHYLDEARRGRPSSQSIVGMHFIAIGQTTLGMYWLHKAAAQGNPYAIQEMQRYEAVMAQAAQSDANPRYPQSVPPLPDVTHVFSHSRIAAKLLADARGGQALAQYRVGETFITQGPNDLTSALYWYRKAADQGYEPAAEKVSICEHSEQDASLQRATDSERTSTQDQVTASARAAVEQQQHELTNQLIEQVRTARDARDLRCTDNEGIVSLLTISERLKGVVAEGISPGRAVVVFVDARRVVAQEKVTAYVVHVTPYEISVFVTSSPSDAGDGGFGIDRNTLYLTTDAPTRMLGFELTPSDRIECTATQSRRR